MPVRPYFNKPVTTTKTEGFDSPLASFFCLLFCPLRTLKPLLTSLLPPPRRKDLILPSPAFLAPPDPLRMLSIRVVAFGVRRDREYARSSRDSVYRLLTLICHAKRSVYPRLPPRGYICLRLRPQVQEEVAEKVQERLAEANRGGTQLAAELAAVTQRAAAEAEALKERVRVAEAAAARAEAEVEEISATANSEMEGLVSQASQEVEEAAAREAALEEQLEAANARLAEMEGQVAGQAAPKAEAEAEGDSAADAKVAQLQAQ
eukprot:1144187-Prorocentrum_minimum.AAC.1